MEYDKFVAQNILNNYVRACSLGRYEAFYSVSKKEANIYVDSPEKANVWIKITDGKLVYKNDIYSVIAFPIGRLFDQ